MTDRLTRIRAATLRLVLMVIAVDVLAVALVAFTNIEEGNRRTIVGVAWLVATMAVLIPGLKAVRVARRS